MKPLELWEIKGTQVMEQFDSIYAESRASYPGVYSLCNTPWDTPLEMLWYTLLHSNDVAL